MEQPPLAAVAVAVATVIQDHGGERRLWCTGMQAQDWSDNNGNDESDNNPSDNSNQDENDDMEDWTLQAFANLQIDPIQDFETDDNYDPLLIGDDSPFTQDELLSALYPFQRDNYQQGYTDDENENDDDWASVVSLGRSSTSSAGLLHTEDNNSDTNSDELPDLAAADFDWNTDDNSLVEASEFFKRQQQQQQDDDAIDIDVDLDIDRIFEDDDNNEQDHHNIYPEFVNTTTTVFPTESKDYNNNEDKNPQKSFAPPSKTSSALDLLEQLGNLTLEFPVTTTNADENESIVKSSSHNTSTLPPQDGNNNNNNLVVSDGEDPLLLEPLPPWFYCQPCSSSTTTTLAGNSTIRRSEQHIPYEPPAIGETQTIPLLTEETAVKEEEQDSDDDGHDAAAGSLPPPPRTDQERTERLRALYQHQPQPQQLQDSQKRRRRRPIPAPLNSTENQLEALFKLSLMNLEDQYSSLLDENNKNSNNNSHDDIMSDEDRQAVLKNDPANYWMDDSDSDAADELAVNHDNHERQYPQQQHDDGDDDVQQQHASRRPFRVSYRPEALQAARALATAFGVDIDEDHDNNNNNNEQQQLQEHSPNKKNKSRQRNESQERSCLGHKERILGCQFSPCGQYLATASQDSTVRIWNASTNALLSTLDHRAEYECLRVAWASSVWGKDSLDHRTGNNNNNNKSLYHYLLATGSADGMVQVWGCADPANVKSQQKKDSWRCLATLDHSTFRHCRGATKQDHAMEEGEGDDDAGSSELKENADNGDKPQVYALQFIDDWKALPGANSDQSNSFLLTSSDDHVHLWEIDTNLLQQRSSSEDGTTLPLREVFSLRFGDMNDYAYGVTVCQVTSSGMMQQSPFGCQHHPSSPQGGPSLIDATTGNATTFGGHRNPEGLVYVFDATYCPANGLLGAALSDGTLRLINGRGICLSILQLPGVNSHLTSFAWDSSGRRLATCVATGHLITWSIDTATTTTSNEDESSAMTMAQNVVRTSCWAVMEGGHEPGRPLFGTIYTGGPHEELLLSWGVDGRLCVWDSWAQQELHAPLGTLLHKAEYPMYAVHVHEQDQRKLQAHQDQKDQNQESPESVGEPRLQSRIAVAGGGSQPSFVGTPVYLYDVKLSDHELQQQVTATGENDTRLFKKSKTMYRGVAS